MTPNVHTKNSNMSLFSVHAKIMFITITRRQLRVEDNFFLNKLISRRNLPGWTMVC